MAVADANPPGSVARPMRPTVESLLKAWRAAERRLEAATGPAARAAAQRDVEACRAAYLTFQAELRAFEARGRSEPFAEPSGS